MKSRNEVNIRFNELAPCGVYCGACPSYGKTCKGCASESKDQKRISKWSCKIRDCCYNQKQLDYCIFCDEFPCKLIDKKLLSTHKGDPKFIYRHEIPGIFSKAKVMDIEDYLDFQKQRWKCKVCEGTVHFYIYACNKCRNKQVIE